MLQDSFIPWILLLILLLCRLVFVEGGGRLLAPQGRGSVCEQKAGAGGVPDSENDMNCGGVLLQWGNWGGMCGVCGDEWGIPPPRPHELGGRWGSGGVVQTYLAGQTINVEIELTLSLGGSFQLQLCPDPVQESEECFSKHPLSLITPSNTTHHPLLGDSLVKLAYQLPLNMTCSHCVLRWRYTTNHMVTLDRQDNLFQEEFRACADIAIEGGNSEEHSIEVNTIQAIGSEASLILVVKEAVTEDSGVTEVDIMDELEPNPFSEFTTSLTPVTSMTDVPTIVTSDDDIENSTESEESSLTTTIDDNTDIDLDEDNIKIFDYEEIIDRNVIKAEQVVEKADDNEEITMKPGVMEIKIIGGESSEKEVSVYTVSPQAIPVEYNLIRIRNNTLSDETNQEDDKPDYEITRTKPTAKSDSQISSSPANVTSVIPLSTSNPALQTTDHISKAVTVTPTGVSVAVSTTTQTTLTTTVSTTQTIIMSSAVILPLVIPSETQQETTVQYLSLVSSPTTTRQNPTTVTTLGTTSTVPTSPKSTPTQTITTQTLPLLKLIITTPVTKSTMSTTPNTIQPPSNTVHILTTTTLLPKNVPKQAKDSKKVLNSQNSINEEKLKKVPNSPNSISIESLKKVPSVPSPEPTRGVQTNHTVIYQVFSRGPSLGYGLFLSVPAAIIFFVGVFLIYIKKSSEVPNPKKAQSCNQSVSTMYHSVPKDDAEVAEGDATHLTNMTSSTTLITSEYIPMSPEYAYIPDVVPSSVRTSQRQHLDDSVDAGCCPGNSMPTLPQVSSTQPQPENTAVQYSSLNELNSTENSPKPGTKRWQSDDLDAEKGEYAPVEGWAPHQRWKSEDWEKDQSFIALLARRLEHVDSRAEVTEL